MTLGLSLPKARPYPWPYDGCVTPSATALLVVAPQVGFVPAGGAAAGILAAIGRLEVAVAAWGGSIIRTRHAAAPASRRPSPLPSTGSAGWALIGDVAGGVVVDAFGVDAFASSALESVLHGAGIDHLLLCGIGLEGAVHSTMRSANDRGLECVLVAGACVPVDGALTDPALSSIEMSGGIFGAVAEVADVEAALAATYQS